MTYLYEFFIDNIIRFVLFINNIITKISLIYETEKELRELRFDNNNKNLMIKYSYEELTNEKAKRIECDNKLLELRQLYLRKLLEDDTDEKICKLENINNKYHNLNIELLKKIDELNKTILVNTNDYKNKHLKLEKIIMIKTEGYNNLEIELKRNLDEKNYNIKHLQFLLKKSYCNNRKLRNKTNKIIEYYYNQEV